MQAPQEAQPCTPYVSVCLHAGVTEAFVHAVLDARTLALSNLLLAGFTVAHVGGVFPVPVIGLNILCKYTSELFSPKKLCCVCCW